jgi:hypothetical protein
MVNVAQDASGQDDRDQEHKGLLDEANDRTLAEEEQGRGETDRPCLRIGGRLPR